jgi:hypothetical protein
MKLKTRHKLIVSVSGTTDMDRVVDGFSIRRGRRGDLRNTPPRGGIAPVPMGEHFLRGQPMLEVASLRPAILNPDQVGGVLDFSLSWPGVRRNRDRAFHDESRFLTRELSSAEPVVLRTRWPGVRISWLRHQAATPNGLRGLVA